MSLAFSDNFDSIDPNIWTARTFYESSAVGLQDRLPNQYNSSNVYADRGLHIRADVGVGEYVSGWIDTRGKRFWKYGYFETRMRVPNVPGIWIGFFGVNEDGFPPEIDSGEIFGNDGKVQFQIRANADYKLLYTYGSSLLGQYHKYAFLWDAEKVAWYIDDYQYWIDVGHSPSVFMSMYFIFGMGEWQTPNDALLPAVLDVDYIKIWQP